VKGAFVPSSAPRDRLGTSAFQLQWRSTSGYELSISALRRGAKAYKTPELAESFSYKVNVPSSMPISTAQAMQLGVDVQDVFDTMQFISARSTSTTSTNSAAPISCCPGDAQFRSHPTTF